jgi:NAD+ diphosphatase
MDYKYCPLCGSDLTSVEISGRLRQKCSSPNCDFLFWGNPTPVVAAVVEYEGNVILVRNKGWPEKWIGVVAGFLERDETPEEGILREVREEIGLEGEIAGLIGNYAFALLNQVILAYHIRAHGKLTLGDEIDAYRAIPPDELRPWNLGTGQAVKDWLKMRKDG